MFCDSYAQLSWTVENLSPVQNSVNVILNPFGALSELIVQFLPDLDHQFCGFNHVSSFDKLNFSFKVSYELLASIVTRFYLSELVISCEFVN